VARIIETRRLTPVTKYFRLDAPLIAASAQPGQFVMLRVREGGERIPITIADYDRDAGTITIVVQEVGATTKRVCALEAGDEAAARRAAGAPTANGQPSASAARTASLSGVRVTA